jgi:hypothetical protein
LPEKVYKYLAVRQIPVVFPFLMLQSLAHEKGRERRGVSEMFGDADTVSGPQDGEVS